MNKEKGLFTELLVITVIPLMILAITVTVLCNERFTKTIYGQVEKELKDIAVSVLDTYDMAYPGNYTMVEDEKTIRVYKGKNEITGDNTFIDSLKEDTGIDITIYYYNTRILTTLYNDGKRLVGTYCSSVVENDVLEKKKSNFYKSVYLGEEEYFAYYQPVFNADNECVGIVFTGKPVAKIKKEINMNLIPLVTVIIIFILIIVILCLRYTNRILKYITSLKNFMGQIANGNLSTELNTEILKRNDEIGTMGRSAVEMQNSLRVYVEQDVLTKINNRRYGEKRLSKILRELQTNGVKFTVAIGDIDYFKKVNDTYGHECGDMVLKKVAFVLRKNMQSNGFAARWGGEEFLLVFYDCDLKKAVEILKNISEEINNMNMFYDGNEVSITMTFGVTQGDSSKKEHIIIKEADDRLYVGKKTGRNRIIDRNV